MLLAVVPAGVTLVASAAAAASPASEAAYAEGQTLLNAKKLGEAADKFEAAVAADPGYASAWYSLAVARRRMSQCTGAIAAYRRYAALEPDKSEPYYGLGLCLRETGDRPGAIEALKHYIAIEKQPASQRWVENARSILTELGATATATTRPLRRGDREIPAGRRRRSEARGCARGAGRASAEDSSRGRSDRGLSRGPRQEPLLPAGAL